MLGLPAPGHAQTEEDMAYYGNHNLAYDFTIFEEQPNVGPYAKGKDKRNGDKPGEEPRGAEKENNASSDRGKRLRKKVAESKRPRRRSRIGRTLLGVIAVLAVIVAVVSIIHGQVQLTELNQEIIDARAELAEKQSVYTQLEMKVDSSISTSAVEQYAKDTLGMTKAANSQKEFISLSEGDKAEVTLKEDKNIFERIADAIASLWS